ncbi:putative Diguanylate cyclase with PAS/PAC sensor [Desulfamplus magnetovallimortis]|uniref:diguanylate cyclase n=1 Tax=Desulfamplus magnetovallimortis TaxID=1246637 RepID=A0A1W1HFU0_9BACT|nr:histidine kinase N-terminal 7TM domain-containing protein [Desulfamplus magnetovallimortis]SLM31347.1 putative Diguanylate cyclase with PAS/PAC sensor [Desulfamplus magnetovallimortis]
MNIELAHIMLFVSFFCCISLCIYSLKYKFTHLNFIFSLFTAAAAIYTLGYAFELMSVNLETMLFWSKIQYIGIPFLPGLLIAFTLCYTGYENKVTNFGYLIFFVIPVISFIARWSNQYHHLFYKNTAVFNSHLGPMLSFEPGIFYFINIIYLVFALSYCTVVFINYFLKTAFVYRMQSLLIIASLTIQWFTLIIYLSGTCPKYFDINPYMFTISAILYAFSIYRFSLFNIIPVAREVIFDEMNDAIIIINPEMQLIDFNKRCASLFNEINDKAIGKNIEQIFVSRPKIINSINNISVAEVEVIIENGTDRLFLELSFKSIKTVNKSSACTIITFHNITEKRILMQKLEKLATVDPLTGVINRRQLEIQADIEMKRSIRMNTPLSVLMFDIDHFKNVNDTWGHQCGDQVLKQFVVTILANIREIDCFGRFGGEEFIMIMPESNRNVATAIAERLRKIVEKTTLNIDGNMTSITVSIGISGRWNNENISMDSLIKYADNALYAAKQNGRNRVEIAELTLM